MIFPNRIRRWMTTKLIARDFQIDIFEIVNRAPLMTILAATANSSSLEFFELAFNDGAVFVELLLARRFNRSTSAAACLMHESVPSRRESARERVDVDDIVVLAKNSVAFAAIAIFSSSGNPRESPESTRSGGRSASNRTTVYLIGRVFRANQRR